VRRCACCCLHAHHEPKEDEGEVDEDGEGGMAAGPWHALGVNKLRDGEAEMGVLGIG